MDLSFKDHKDDSYAYLKDVYIDFVLHHNSERCKDLESRLELVKSRSVLQTSNLATIVQNFYYEIGRRNKYVEDEIIKHCSNDSEYAQTVYYIIYGCLPLVTYIYKNLYSLPFENYERDNLTIYMLVRFLERRMLLDYPFENCKAIDIIRQNDLPHPFSYNNNNYLSMMEGRYDLNLSKIMSQYVGDPYEFLIHIIFLTAISSFENTFTEDAEEIAWKSRMGIERYNTHFNPYYRPLELYRYPIFIPLLIGINHLKYNEREEALFSNDRDIPIISKYSSFKHRSYSSDYITKEFTNSFHKWVKLLSDQKKNILNRQSEYCINYLSNMKKVNIESGFGGIIPKNGYVVKMFDLSLHNIYQSNQSTYVFIKNKMIIHCIFLERLVYQIMLQMLSREDQINLPKPNDVISIVKSQTDKFYVRIKRNLNYKLPGKDRLTKYDINALKGLYLSYIIAIVFNLKLTKSRSDFELIDFCYVDNNKLFAYIPNTTNSRIIFNRDFRIVDREKINYFGLLLGDSRATLKSSEAMNDDDGYGDDEVNVYFSNQTEYHEITATIMSDIWCLEFQKEYDLAKFGNTILDLMMANKDLLYSIYIFYEIFFFGQVREEQDIFLNRLEGLHLASKDVKNLHQRKNNY